eukprot:967755_1
MTKKRSGFFFTLSKSASGDIFVIDFIRLLIIHYTIRIVCIRDSKSGVIIDCILSRYKLWICFGHKNKRKIEKQSTYFHHPDTIIAHPYKSPYNSALKYIKRPTGYYAIRYAFKKVKNV